MGGGEGGLQFLHGHPSLAALLCCDWTNLKVGHRVSDPVRVGSPTRA